MLKINQTVPEALLLDNCAEDLEDLFRAQGAHWCRAMPEYLGLVHEDSDSIGWIQSCCSDVQAKAAAPNLGHSFWEKSDSNGEGLVFKAGMNCGFSIPLVDEKRTSFSCAIRYNSLAGEARTLLTLNSDVDGNYLFLQEQSGDLLLKDRFNTFELLARAAPTGTTGLVVFGVSDGVVSLRASPQDDIVRSDNIGLSFDDGGGLFIGCRSDRKGLLKTLGSYILQDVMFWPDADITEAEHGAILKAVDRFHLWEV